jgi:hypothetical protein
MWNGIFNRLDGFEPKHAVFVAVHHTSPIRTIAVGMLNIIVARRVRLPDINLDALDRLPDRIFDSTDAKKWFTVFVVRH